MTLVACEDVGINITVICTTIILWCIGKKQGTHAYIIIPYMLAYQ